MKQAAGAWRRRMRRCVAARPDVEPRTIAGFLEHVGMKSDGPAQFGAFAESAVVQMLRRFGVPVAEKEAVVAEWRCVLVVGWSDLWRGRDRHREDAHYKI